MRADGLDIINSFWFPQVFKNCGAVAGAMFCRLFAYADDAGICFMTTPKMMQDLGENRRPIDTARHKLEECGLISTSLEKWECGTRTRVVINKQHDFLHKGVCAKRTDPTYVQNVQGGMSETHTGVSAKCTGGYVQNVHQYTDINTDINTDKVRNTSAQNFSNVEYDPDLEDLITAYEDGASLSIQQGDTLIRTRNNVQGERAPQIGNYTQSANIATSVKNKGVVEGNSDNTNTPVAKKPKKEHKPRNPQVIPQSAEEVIPYIDKFLKRHEKEEIYKDLDKQYYAGVILDNYLRDDGTWRDNKGTILREPYRKVSGWLSREYEAGKLRRKKDENRQQEMADYIAGLFKEIEEDKAKEAQQKQQGKQAPITADFEIVPDTPKTQILENKHI